MTSHPVRKLLRVAAALVLIGVVALWVATGAHRGWTKTQITEMQHDEVTGIDYPVQRDGLVAGVDLLAAGVGLGLALFGASLLAGRRGRAATP